jgi:hypothetical protein
MSTSDWVWSVILIVGGLYELFTLWTRRQGDTLSEKVWKVFAVVGNEPRRLRQARRVALLFIVVWLAVHFLSGGWL